VTNIPKKPEIEQREKENLKKYLELLEDLL